MNLSKINITGQGPAFSRLVLGYWRLAEWSMSSADLLNFMSACLDLGLTTFDHADIYGDYTCEQIFGRALTQNSALRQKMQLVTKCGIKLVSKNRPQHRLKIYDTRADHITASAENSLKMLQTDYLDLLLIHRPDPLMNADEVAEAFTALRQAGKVLHFGVSNFMPWQFDLLASRLDFPLVTNQIELSVMNIEALHNGVVDQCQKLRISPMAWSPLGGGDIFRENSEKAVRLRHALNLVGNSLGGASPDQVALAWLLHHPAQIVPVLGTGKLERVKSAIQAETLSLSREQWFAILGASSGSEVP